MSATEKAAVKKLSSTTIELKFMKRSKEKFEKQEEDEERRHLYKEQLATLHNSSNCIVMMPSFYDLKTYLPCRLSFGGMEPEIEKLNISKLTGLYKVETPPEVDPSIMKTDVSDEQMAQTYDSNKFKRKGAHSYESQNKRRSGGNDKFQNEGNRSQNNGRFQGLKKDFNNFFQMAENDDFAATRQHNNFDDGMKNEEECETDVKGQDMNLSHSDEFQSEKNNADGFQKKNFNSKTGQFENRNFSPRGNFQNRNFNNNRGNFQNRKFDSPRGKFDSPRGNSRGKKFGNSRGNFQNRNFDSPDGSSQNGRNDSRGRGKFQKKRKSDGNRNFQNNFDNEGEFEAVCDSDINPKKSKFQKNRNDNPKKTDNFDESFSFDVEKSGCEQEMKSKNFKSKKKRQSPNKSGNFKDSIEEGESFFGNNLQDLELCDSGIESPIQKRKKGPLKSKPIKSKPFAGRFFSPSAGKSNKQGQRGKFQQKKRKSDTEPDVQKKKKFQKPTEEG